MATPPPPGCVEDRGPPKSVLDLVKINETLTRNEMLIKAAWQRYSFVMSVISKQMQIKSLNELIHRQIIIGPCLYTN